MILEVLDGQGFDEYGVDGGGDDGFLPGNGVGRDRSIDQVVLGQVSLRYNPLPGDLVPPVWEKRGDYPHPAGWQSG